jgi:hypothetical protein
MRGLARIDAGLLLVIAVSLGVAAVRSRATFTEVGSAARAIGGESALVRGDRAMWQQRMRSASARAPFLLAASPPVHVDSTNTRAAALTESAPTRPSITVQAIVGGPPWHAVIEGVPGKEGSIVVRQGDRFQAFFVRSVGAAGVVIAAADSSWFMPLTRQGGQ